MTTSLIAINKASQMLAEAKDLTDLNQVRGIAQMASEYAKAAKLGLEAQNVAAEIKIRAERKAGELLGELKRGSEMTLGKFLSLRGIKSADPVAFRFRVWLGKKDEGRNYSERIWRATFNIFNRRDRESS